MPGKKKIQLAVLFADVSGVIAFGHSTREPGCDPVEFRCELK